MSGPLSNSALIALTEAKAALEGHEGDPLEDRLLLAMRTTHRHWMATDEDDQFKAAVGAVMLTSDVDTKARLEMELRNLAVISAAMNGLPVNLESIETESEPIGLLRLWQSLTPIP